LDELKGIVKEINLGYWNFDPNSISEDPKWSHLLDFGTKIFEFKSKFQNLKSKI
jgi:hypothetical protein